MSGSKVTSSTLSHHNLRTYEGSEQLHSFTEESFRAYCTTKLEGCRADVERIRRRCVGPAWGGKVVEIGSGNSKLLYSLEREGLLAEGFGLEVSASRHEFAQAFKEWAGSRKTTNVHANVFETDPIPGCDLVCGMDLVLQLLAEMSDDAEDAILEWIHRSLKPGGFLLAEIRDFMPWIQLAHRSESGAAQFWDEFPPPDPWRYLLNRMTVHHDDRTVQWEKTFIKRDSNELWYNTLDLRQYTPNAFSALLERHGFATPHVESERLDLFAIVARKIG